MITVITEILNQRFFSSGIQNKNVAENNRCVIFSKWEKKWRWEGEQIRGKEVGNNKEVTHEGRF